jgi:hypothetical protein
VRGRGRVELAPVGTALGAHGALVGVDLDLVHRAQVDADAVIADGVALDAVAAAVDGDDEAVGARVADRRDDVLRARTSRDERGAAVDHAVEDASCVVVSGVPGAEDGAGQGDGIHASDYR